MATTASLAEVLADEKRYDEAAHLYRETLAIQRRRFGDDHRSTLITAGNLAHMLTDEGKYTEAEQVLRQTLTMQQRLASAVHATK